MSNSTKAWLPDGTLSQPQKQLLSVTASSKPNKSLHRSLLEQKLAVLIEQNPQAAQSALELSQEQAPELWALVEQSPTNQLAPLLVRSEGMTRLLAQVDWTKPGRLADVKPQSLLEIVEQLA